MKNSKGIFDCSVTIYRTVDDLTERYKEIVKEASIAAAREKALLQELEEKEEKLHGFTISNSLIVYSSSRKTQVGCQNKR